MAYDDGVSDEDTPNDSRSDELKKTFARWDTDLLQTWAQWREEARMSYAMVAGDQWDQEAKADLEEQLIAPVSWNRIQPLVDAVSGAQIQNRHEIKFFPREMGDVGANELLTSAAEWAADEGDFEDEESDAFFDALVCGVGWTEMRMDYEEAVEGEIRKDRIDPLEMSADPSAKKRNMADMRYLRRTRPFTKEQFEERFPDWKDEVSANNDPYDMASTGHTHAKDDYDTDDEHTDERRKSGDIFVKEYQWYELESFYRVIDPATQQETELSEGDYQRLDQKFMQHGMDLGGVRAKRRIYYRAFCAGDKIIEHEELPDSGFTYHCITGKRDRNSGIWYGLVRAMVDPQRWANKWMTQILVIINKNSKGGVIVEDDAVPDMREFEEDYAKPDAVSVVASGALAAGKIKDKPQVRYPEGLDRMIQMAISSIRDVTGINQELLGQADRTQPGIVETQRREAGYTMLAMFFDSLRRYRKVSGRMLLKYIQNYISDGRLIRIAGQEGGVQYIPLIRDETMKDYDVIIDESPSGPNQKEKVWGMLVQMMPILQRAPLPPQVWAELVKYSPLPESISQKIIKVITAPPPPEVQQAKQAQQQLMQANAMAEVKKTQTEAQENTAQAQEIAARARKLMLEGDQQAIETLLTKALAPAPDEVHFRAST